MTKARNIADLGSNDVIETSATGVDVTGTVSADGLTVDTGGTAVILNHSATGPTLRFNNLDQTVADGQQLARIEFSTDDGGSTTDEAYLQLTATGGGGAADFDIMTGDGTPVRRARFGVGGDIQFYEDTGTTAKMVWDASAESLTVDGSVRFGYNEGAETDVINWVKGSNNALVFESTSNPDYASGSWGGLQFHSANGYGGQLAGIAVSHRYGDATERQYADGMSFLLKNGGSADNWVEAMALRSSGYVGIGTYNPASKLHVRGPGNPTLTIDGSDGAYTSFLTMKAAGAGASVIRAEGGTNSLVLQTNGDNERARIDSSGGVRVNTTGTVFSQYEKLSVLGSGSNHAGIGVKFGDSSGHGIGIWNTSATGAMAKFAVGSSGTSIGSITHNSSSVAYNTTSDERLKENIQDTTHTVDINDIQVREFDWKVDGNHQRYGFIAQELETVYPEAVHSPEDADEMKSVDYSKLVPLLVKEIQQLKARIETMENN